MHANDIAAVPLSAEQQPSQQDLDQLVALYERGDALQLESATRALLDRHPASAFAWSVLAVALQSQGQDALPALLKTVELAPDDAESQLHLGNAYLASGQLDLALACFMRALEIAPGFAEALSRLGDVLQAQGHLKEAGECYRGALEMEPKLAMAHLGKGDIHYAQRQFQLAEASYREALALAPDASELHRKLADISVEMNRPEQAIERYGAALLADPANAMAHGGLGNVLFRLGRHQQAEASYRAATGHTTAIAAHHHGLARSLHALGQTEAAEAAYRHAIEMDPTVAAPMLHFADLLRETRRKEVAIAVYRAALLLEPGNIDTINNLGMALQEDGQLDQALASFQQVLAIAPENPISHNNIAAILNAMGQPEAALASSRRAVKLGPKVASTHFNLATCLMEAGRLSEALGSFETVVKLEPDNRRAHVNIGSTLVRLGRIDDAISHIRTVLKVHPDWHEQHSNLLFNLTHSPNVKAADLFAEHLHYAEQFETPLRASWPQHSNVRDPERRLRIGIVSADLYNHAVASFITPVLEHLADSPRLEMVAYANSFHDDMVSRHLHGLFSIWRQVEKLTHGELAQLVASDKIDILIDLSGHTGFNRLPTFARKPAPVQSSWIGYPGTTGLQAMDYILMDRHFPPVGAIDAQFTEKIVRLPATAPFLASPEAPPVSPAPAVSNGYITFGSFNRAGKINREVIARWSRLLHLVPGSTMLLAAMPNTQISDKLRSWFVSEGIAASRLTFHGYTNLHDYLALHGKVDVCLDTYPYTSGTTGFNAMWMGVPTLTMVGDTLPGYVTASILANAGLTQFIASDEADFLEKGRLLAADVEALNSLRLGMRERMQQSPNGQPALIAAAFESALRSMWQRWCAGQAPAAFAVDTADVVVRPHKAPLP